MNFEQIINSSILHLPVKPSNSFRNNIFSVLDNFLNEVNSLSDGELGIDDINITGRYVKDVQRHFIQGLKDTINEYYNGYPSNAYKRLKRTLESEMKDFRQILKLHDCEEAKNFYRIRVRKDNIGFLLNEMFHIPFEQRGNVTTQRYSIPGFPCLYLGQSLYSCWEEMSRPNINEFQSARLQNVVSMRYLDLTRPNFKDIQNFRSRDLYHYFMTWPLIACCSVVVNDYNNSFKPEYIVPQLLLQWIRGTHSIDGIKYNSTHINIHDSQSVGDFSNWVLPVKESNDEGHCSQLKSMFHITNPVSWQMKEFAVGGVTFTYSEAKKDDYAISRLEIIKGKVYPYDYSVFGRLEGYLKGMSLNVIE